MNGQTFSQHFKLHKSQYELDFVDIPVESGDIPLFIDPYAISRRADRWSIQCHNLIVNFFQDVITFIRDGNKAKANYMLSGLREPNQTCFGLSTGNKPRGRGIGREQATDLFDALAGSTAVKTGFIKDLQDCELLIDGIGRDKISDITANIIKGKLIEYTSYQCLLWDIPTIRVPSGHIWEHLIHQWKDSYVQLPMCNKRIIWLVPKAIARFNIEFSSQDYYQHFVLNFLQEEYLSAGSSLVRVLKDGTKKEPTKKSLQEIHPLTKEFLYNFSKEHPEVLEKYRKSKGFKIKDITNEHIGTYLGLPRFDYVSLINELKTIATGDSDANRYHEFIKGALTAIFYPDLINPMKEVPIHEKRKRIDIVFDNAAKDGFFWSLHNIKKVPSAYIFTECKNYSSDPSNPELDQLSGRFGLNRGQFGLLVCRKISNKPLFYKRCKDTKQDGRGSILAFDDADIINLLNLRKAKDQTGIDKYLEDKYRILVM